MTASPAVGAPDRSSSGTAGASAPARSWADTVGATADEEPQYLPPPPPEEVNGTGAPRRPMLTVRDALEAVQLATPSNLSAVVAHLTATFASRRTPREVALVVFGMFVGRLGVARQLRTHALTSTLQGVPPAAILTAALVYLEDLAGGLQDHIEL